MEKDKSLNHGGSSLPPSGWHSVFSNQENSLLPPLRSGGRSEREMGSDENKFSEPSVRKLCANGCGFFGTAATMNLCSKCYRDLRVTGEQAASAKAKLVNPNPVLFSLDSSSAVESPPVVDSVAPVAANRCSSCNKKVGVMGFKCRCGSTFCGAHRYPEKHECSFDFKGSGRDAIAHANPVVKADKVKRF